MAKASQCFVEEFTTLRRVKEDVYYLAVSYLADDGEDGHPTTPSVDAAGGWSRDMQPIEKDLKSSHTATRRVTRDMEL